MNIRGYFLRNEGRGGKTLPPPLLFPFPLWHLSYFLFLFIPDNFFPLLLLLSPSPTFFHPSSPFIFFYLGSDSYHFTKKAQSRWKKKTKKEEKHKCRILRTKRQRKTNVYRRRDKKARSQNKATRSYPTKSNTIKS